jgi:hypothetical protein
MCTSMPRKLRNDAVLSSRCIMYLFAFAVLLLVSEVQIFSCIGHSLSFTELSKCFLVTRIMSSVCQRRTDTLREKKCSEFLKFNSRAGASLVSLSCRFTLHFLGPRDCKYIISTSKRCVSCLDGSEKNRATPNTGSVPSCSAHCLC